MIPEPTQRRAPTLPWSLQASLALHCLLALLALLVAPHPLAPPQQQVIAVDMVAPEQYAALLPAPLSVEPVAVPQPIVETPPVLPPAEDTMIEARQFYAGGILGDPANAAVRANFPLLASSEQLIQLCNMEALEQLRLSGAAAAPDALVGYAFDSVAVDHAKLHVEGGAFRSGGQWFHIRYDCTALPDMTGVSAFAYAVGALVPQGEWEEHFLNGDDDWLN